MNIDDYMSEMEELTNKISNKKSVVHANGDTQLLPMKGIKDRMNKLESSIKNIEGIAVQFIESSRSFAAKIEGIEERMDDIEQLQSSQVEKLERLPALIKKLEALANGNNEGSRVESLEDTLKNAIDVLESISGKISGIETRLKKIEQKPAAKSEKPAKKSSSISDIKARIMKLKKSR
ncbi:MAG TPA: hypothetical protein VI968_00575 [archaeon]|nr:hypothetical protein [archaeon]